MKKELTEQEAKEEFFRALGSKVVKEFIGASVKDLIEFAEKLKEWAITTEIQISGV